MQFRFFLAASAASLSMACALATPAVAQSTGSIDFDQQIIVTGTRSGVEAVAGISAPDTTKAKAILTQENIIRQNPGQTVLDTINQVPGVSFQNNDAYGSSGGTLNIRGFSQTRVSLTFDGLPLNDSGNYEIYSGQQVDPEIIEQVNVNLGTTDVDSPTASAAGGTVNLRTKTPDRDFGVNVSASLGEFAFYRVHAKIETGDLTASGLRAYVAGSKTENENPFNNYGKVNKQQINAKIYQPLSGNDFVSISGHYNVNRNNFFGSLPLRLDVGRVVGSGSGNRYPANGNERKYLINFPCTISAAVAGVEEPANSCGTEFDRRYNPSNTGNIRISSRITLSDSLVLTVDPSFQWVKANGGGTTNGFEGLRDINPAGGTANVVACRTAPISATNTCVAGYFGGAPYFGRDVNGDGDALDGVAVLTPSQTTTRRFGVIANLRWDINDQHTMRLAYTLDHARHRQTGEVTKLLGDGEPVNVFAPGVAEKDVNSAILQKRDRLSFAILQQVALEYRGEFMDERLTVNAGARLPFFKRDLTQNCFTSSASGFVECFGGNSALVTQALALNPYTATVNANGTVSVRGWAAPQQRVLNYRKLLPNVGLVFDVADNVSIFGNFSQGISVPATDSLYNAFFFPLNIEGTQPKPETTDNFDLGVRYRSGTIQAQFTGFYNKFQNRLASAFDPELNQTVFRNLGDVKKYGIDGSIAYQPIPELTFYVFGSLIKSEIRDDLVVGRNSDGTPVFAPTAGKREAGAPKSTFGFTARAKVGVFELGVTAKHTGERFVFDTNEATFTGSLIAPGAKACSSATVCVAPTTATSRTQVYGATAPGYWLVNLDARLDLGKWGLPEKTYLQLNVYNLFDQFYVGGFGGNLNQTQNFAAATGVSTYGNPGFVQIGAPRTVSATFSVSF